MREDDRLLSIGDKNLAIMYVATRQTFRKLLPYIFLLGVLFGLLFFIHTPAHATTGINQQINFQGRLLTSSGATVPDGFYNIQFKIYQDGDGLTAGDATGSPTGSLKWTESYLNNNSQGVQVINGYMSVQLGSITPFGASINWNQDTLWLSMNIGSTNATCTPFTSCTPDGEMVPMKRLSSNPYALNAGQLGGVASSGFVQLAQGVQTDASVGVNSIYINKTSTGNFVDFQSSSIDVFTLTNGGDISYGANANHTLSVATAAASVAGKSLTLTSGAAGTGAGALAGGNLILQGGAGGGTGGNGGNVTIDGGSPNGAGTAGLINIGASVGSTINIGTVNASNTINIGDTTLSTGTQNINIGNSNTSGGTTNVTIGDGATATGGTTTVQAKTSISINTNGIARETIDNAGDIYFGNGVTAAAPSNFTLSGTGSATTAVAGGTVTLQGGNATVGSANGGNVTITGGTGIGSGVNGIVVLTTPTFSTTANDANCYTSGALVASSCTIAATSVNNSSAVIVGFSTSAQTATLPDPTNATAGRIVYITAANGSQDFSLSVNGGGTGNIIAMRQNTSATMIWNGTDWTAAGASSSTTLQSAYNNTLQSAGGAELVVSKTSNTNGLTIRDSSTNPVNGTLLSVQTASAAGLLSVNGNVTEYSSDSGAEVAGGTSSTFPASTWATSGTGVTLARYTTAGNYINTGQGSASVQTSATASTGVLNTLSTTLTANNHYNVSFAARLDSTSATFTTMNVWFSINGTTQSVACSSAQKVPTSVWTKINCSFTAPSSGITSTNAILIQQSDAVAHKFYIDNLSVTIAADYNLATDGGVDDNTNFATNWTTAGAGTVAVTRNTLDGNDASDSAQAAISTNTAAAGLRNKLSINPLTSTLYRVSVYAKLNSGAAFTDFKVRYSPDNGTSFVDCVDYNLQTVTTTAWTQITCYINTITTTVTTPYVYFVQTAAPGGARTFSVDTFSMTLSGNTTPNVQVGGGLNGGPTTLFTLDKGASAPIAANNDALLGSMYYDTTLGKLQCYEADGWGACGSSPDNIITISPEYTNAVLHGTGVGTMTSDLCSDTLAINDGSSGQPTICGTNETYNFYQWTSPQATAQTYSIYVTYQLPTTFKSFTSGTTSIKGRTNNGSSGGTATVQYTIYKNNSAGLTTCNSTPVTVSTGTQTTWQNGPATGTADPSTCGFAPSDSIVFKIDMIANKNALAYVTNLGFTFSNK